MFENASSRQSQENSESVAVAAVSEVAPPASNGQATVSDEVFEVRIPRDLAVQLVGSDAGRERRIRPQGHMTKNATPEERVAVEHVMQPFLESEIKRRHEDKSHRLREFTAKVNPFQARAIKKFSLGYAAHLKQHLAKHPGDDRYHRSQQRLDQIHSVVQQINLALGAPFDDGQGIEECVAQAESTLRQLLQQLEVISARMEASDDVPERAFDLTNITQQLRRLVSQCR